MGGICGKSNMSVEVTNRRVAAQTEGSELRQDDQTKLLRAKNAISKTNAKTRSDPYLGQA